MIRLDIDNNTIRLAGIIPESYTDGTGVRCTLFMQGCAHRCEECHNPETWDFNGGALYNIDKLVNLILEDPLLDGITFSGGDPMYSPRQVIQVVDKVKERNPNLNFWLYTGFTYEQCLNNPDMKEVLSKIDVLVDGPYMKSCRSLSLKFRGSSNQRIIDTKKSLETGDIKLAIED